ncbi:hypothetical protein WG66_004025, partial [Moniliophthora roreri]
SASWSWEEKRHDTQLSDAAGNLDINFADAIELQEVECIHDFGDLHLNVYDDHQNAKSSALLSLSHPHSLFNPSSLLQAVSGS